MAHDGQAYWHQGGGDGSEEDHENDEGDRDADAFSLPQVVFRELVIVVVGAGVPYQVHAEAVLPVGFLDDVEEGGDVLQGIFEAAGHDQGHDGGHAVIGRDGGWVVGEIVVLLRSWLDDVVPQGKNIVIDRFDLCLELGGVHGEGVRLDDNYLADRFGAPEPVLQQTVGAFGLGAAPQPKLRGRAPVEYVRERLRSGSHFGVHGEPARDQPDHGPDGDDDQRPSRTDTGQEFSHETTPSRAGWTPSRVPCRLAQAALTPPSSAASP